MSLINELRQIVRDLKRTRAAINERLMVEGVDDPGILKCVFLAGGPGSGKSYKAQELFGVGKQFKFASSGLKLVNSDSAFEAGLRKNGINPKDLARIEKEDPELWNKITEFPNGIREKAKQLTQKQRSFYEAGRLGMIIDGTGDNFAKIQKQKEHAESLGYDCYMVFINTSLEVAMERNRKRDRTLPDAIVQDIWKNCQENLGKFQQLFGSYNFQVVDNTDAAPADPYIQKAITRFINTPTKNPIGKKWMDTARILKAQNII